MGLSQDYPNVPDWEFKDTGYQTGSMVKYQGNVFFASFWAQAEPGKKPQPDEGWVLYDELYDQTTSGKTEQAKIIAYIPTWRKKEGLNYANDEMYRYITHGIIAFLMFSEINLGEFEPNSVNDVYAVLSDVVNTGHRNGTRISIALGGAVDYGFLNLMTSIGNNPDNPLLDQAVQNVVNFININNLDGVDLDLECWWDRNGDPTKDQGGRFTSQGAHPAGYALTLFAQKLRQAMPDKLVSAAIFGTSWYGNNYDPKLADHVDWLGIMTYDLSGSWNSSPVGPHTALYKIRQKAKEPSSVIHTGPFQEDYQEEQQGSWPPPNPNQASSDPIFDNPILSVEDTLWYWTNPLFVNWQGAGQKISRNKIAGGVPIYGYDFAYIKDTDVLSGKEPPGYKVIRYKDILAQFPDAHTAPNANIKVSGSTPRPAFISASGNYPYAHNIYFETPDTAVAKLNFLKDVGAQGVIIWELSNDVWEESKSIIKALYKNSGNLVAVPSLELMGVTPGSKISNALWGRFTRAKTTNNDGTTTYSARLWNIEGSWEEACHNAPAIIRGQWFDRPTRCVNTVTGMWGEFDVKQANSGKPIWSVPIPIFGDPGSFKRDDCTGYGCRQYSARLWDIEGSWEEACNNAPAIIKGQWFDRPTRIVNTGITGIWGEFDVEDDSCGSLTKLVEMINKLIGEGTKQVSRSDVGLQEEDIIHLDLGGEGYHIADGIVSGFRTAINLNGQKNDSQHQDREIPHLILVDFSKPYPFADGFADYITMQGAPLTTHNVDEIVRMLRKGGKVGLWIEQESFQDQIKDLAKKLNSSANEVNKYYEDEFGGKAGYKKLLINKNNNNPARDEL